MPTDFLKKKLRRLAISEARIKKLEMRVKPFIQDKIKSVIRGMQAIFECFEVQMIEHLRVFRLLTYVKL